MTALEYMERQLIKHRLNFDREATRKGVTPEQLENISKKIHYYEEAVEALRRVGGHGGGKCRTRKVVRVDEQTGEIVRFPSVKEARLSIGGTALSMNLLTNRPLKGYRFFYEEDWEDAK